MIIITDKSTAGTVANALCILEITLTFGILEDALQEVGDDYPGSGLQEWCQQQVRFARFALEGTEK